MYDVSTLYVHREKIQRRQIMFFNTVKQGFWEMINISHLTDTVKLIICHLDFWDQGLEL
jgi:hypothetical protein